MGHLPTADQQGKLLREEWRWLSSRAIAPRAGGAGTVNPCHWLAYAGCHTKPGESACLFSFLPIENNYISSAYNFVQQSWYSVGQSTFIQCSSSRMFQLKPGISKPLARPKSGKLPNEQSHLYGGVLAHCLKSLSSSTWKEILRNCLTKNSAGLAPTLLGWANWYRYNMCSIFINLLHLRSRRVVHFSSPNVHHSQYKSVFQN